MCTPDALNTTDALNIDSSTASSLLSMAIPRCETDCHAGPAELSHLVSGLRGTLGLLFADSCVQMLANNRWAVCLVLPLNGRC